MGTTFTRVGLLKENFAMVNALMPMTELKRIGVGMNAYHITRMTSRNLVAMGPVSISTRTGSISFHFVETTVLKRMNSSILERTRMWWPVMENVGYMDI